MYLVEFVRLEPSPILPRPPNIFLQMCNIQHRIKTIMFIPLQHYLSVEYFFLIA